MLRGPWDGEWAGTLLGVTGERGDFLRIWAPAVDRWPRRLFISILEGLNFFFILFLIGGLLLDNIVMVSALLQYEMVTQESFFD